MSSHRAKARTIAGSLLTAAFSAVMVLSFTASADDQGPGSSKGGKAMDAAPAGVKLTTLLPEKISVDNSSKKTAICPTWSSSTCLMIIPAVNGPITLNLARRLPIMTWRWGEWSKR